MKQQKQQHKHSEIKINGSFIWINWFCIETPLQPQIPIKCKLKLKKKTHTHRHTHTHNSMKLSKKSKDKNWNFIRLYYVVVDAVGVDDMIWHDDDGGGGGIAVDGCVSAWL